MKRLGLAIAVLFVSIGLVFAGGQGEPTAESTGENPTGNPWTDGQDLSGRTVNIFGAFVDTDAERFQASMEPFIKETGINVVYEGSGDFETLISIRAEGGDPPNIAAFPQPGLMADLTRRGYVLDAGAKLGNSYLSQQYSPAWIELSKVDDTIVGVWYRANLKSLVWYAKPVFDQQGYEIPTTWDEMIALSDQMVADGFTPWSIGIESSGATGWVATDWIEDILLRTASPEKYDQWTRGELPFDSPEIRNAIEIMAEIWFNPDYVLGGTNSILTVPFGDAPTPLMTDPPRALLHRQANFIPGFFPEGTVIGEDIDYFYLPPIDPAYGKPVLGAGDILAPMVDNPETWAVLKYLSQGVSTKAWLEAGGFVSPHNDTPLEWYPSDVERGYAEIILEADTFRFDGSDLMPGQVGAGSFWEGMVDYVSGEDLDAILARIDSTWP